MKLLRSIPLLILVYITYFAIALITENPDIFAQELWSFTLPTDRGLALSLGDGLVVFASIMLLLEVLKATDTGSLTIVDHGISLCVLIGAVVLFLTTPSAGTDIYFLLLLFSVIDVMAGFTITVRTAQRDINFPH